MSDTGEDLSDARRRRRQGSTLIGSRTLQREAKTILDRVEHGGESMVILRNGRAAAALVPVDQERAEAIVLGGSPRFERNRKRRESATVRTERPFAVLEETVDGDDEAHQRILVLERQVAQLTGRLEEQAAAITTLSDDVSEAGNLRRRQAVGARSSRAR